MKFIFYGLDKLLAKEYLSHLRPFSLLAVSVRAFLDIAYLPLMLAGEGR